MAEQQNVPKVEEKKEHSKDYVNCKLSYDCLMASTKSFIHNFNNLTINEKLEFKCMGNYVKQLEKCMLTIKNNMKPVVHQVKLKLQREEVAKPKGATKKKDPVPIPPIDSVVVEAEQPKMASTKKTGGKK